ncbi:hypothetical protein [Paenibacillus sp. y28]|uniref:hypothetical protein n=1 Tax=Paenibacillus sp. y28 TaxID=3129110 RepID=UPI0030160779
MINSIEVLIEPLVRTRLKSLYNELLKSNPHYAQLAIERDQYFKQLLDSIPGDLEHTLFLHKDAQISLQNIQEVKLYLQGFKDALYLNSEINL